MDLYHFYEKEFKLSIYYYYSLISKFAFFISKFHPKEFTFKAQFSLIKDLLSPYFVNLSIFKNNKIKHYEILL